MTQEEKAKAYDEAIERAKDFIKGEAHYALRKGENIMCWIFPELAESEDERIRNWLIGYFHQYKEDGMEKYANGLKVESIIAWIEKQDEQKSQRMISAEAKEAMYDKPTDLEVFINELSKQFPDVSFAKLSRIAVRVAKWAKPTDEEMKELLRTEYEKGRADVIAEMQKPSTIDIEEMVLDYANNKERGNEIFGKPVNCMVRAYRQGLNDAIGKVLQKPAWSEEDELMFLSTIQSIEMTNGAAQLKIDWLKSLKDRCTWKPDEWQLKAIKWILDGDNPENWTVTLTNLYNDLKKLSQS